MSPRAPAASPSMQRLRRDLLRLGAPRTAPAIEHISPMQAESRPLPWSGAGWLFELKYDGYRLLAGHTTSGSVRLLYRSGLDATALFPHLAIAVAALPAKTLVLDGEVAALDAAGWPRFALLQALAADRPVVYFVFDLLAWDGFDLRPLPLVERKEALRQVLAAGDPAGPLRYVEAFAERGEDLFAAVGEMGLEGIVGKRAASRYTAGRSTDWLKVRRDRVGDFAIVGYGPAAPADLRRLHLAAPVTGGGWHYAGSVGSGLGAAARREVSERLAAMAASATTATTATTAAIAGPATSGRMLPPAMVRTIRADRRSIAIEPRLVCEVRYKEWTPAGHLRQPVFLRLRPDKRPDECEPAPAAGAEAEP